MMCVMSIYRKLFVNYEKSVFLELHSSLRTSVLVSSEVAVTTVEMKINRLISFRQGNSPAAATGSDVLLDRLIFWMNPDAVVVLAVPWLLLACWSPEVAKMISKLSSPWPTNKQNPKLKFHSFKLKWLLFRKWFHYSTSFEIYTWACRGVVRPRRIPQRKRDWNTAP